MCLWRVLQPATYPNVPTKRREHTPDSSGEKIVELQKQVGFFSFGLKDVEHVALKDRLRRRASFQSALGGGTSQVSPRCHEFCIFFQIEELKEEIKTLSQQPTCTPVFKRFLRRLLKEIQRVGLVRGLFLNVSLFLSIRDHSSISSRSISLLAT